MDYAVNNLVLLSISVLSIYLADGVTVSISRIIIIISMQNIRF